jgi:4-hydroxybenzoate polyprenyltransferase
VTAVAGLLAGLAGRGAGGTAAVAAAILAGQLSVGWSNDWLDATRDREAGRTDKPAAVGALDPATLGRAAFGALAAAVGLSFLSGWRAALAHIAAVGSAWAYNLGLKRTRLSWVPYAVSFALLPTFVALGLPGHPAPHAWAPLAGALIGIGAHAANTLPDLDTDRAQGVWGLPQRLGAGPTRVLSVVALLAATVVVGYGPGPPGSGVLAGLAVSAAVAAAGLVAARRPGGERFAFRAVLVMALLDVALLTARGARLG